jgi:uncharacterized membrane protein YhaH (DUF805 family)
LKDALNGFGYFKNCWKHYADFKGRAKRKEFWYFTLFSYLIIFMLCIIGGIIGQYIGNNIYSNYDWEYDWIQESIQESIIYGILCAYIPYMIAVLLPSLAVSMRRLHDVGKSGWWILINLIPFAGNMFFIVLMCLDSQDGINKWGLNPKKQHHTALTKMF